MAAWGNALGGYKLQRRTKGRFGSRVGSYAKYRRDVMQNNASYRSRDVKRGIAGIHQMHGAKGSRAQVKQTIRDSKSFYNQGLKNEYKKNRSNYRSNLSGILKEGHSGQHSVGVVSPSSSPTIPPVDKTRKPRRVAKKDYRSAKKRNAKAHRARVKGSVKARGREITKLGPARAKNVVGGAALYTAGSRMNSPQIKATGLSMVKYGVHQNKSRVNSTRAMSKGLQKSHNRRAKDNYYSAIGTSRRRRNAAKLAGGVVAVGAVGYALKTDRASIQTAGPKGSFVSMGPKASQGGVVGFGYGMPKGVDSLFASGYAKGRSARTPTYGVAKNKAKAKARTKATQAQRAAKKRAAAAKARRKKGSK